MFPTPIERTSPAARVAYRAAVLLALALWLMPLLAVALTSARSLEDLNMGNYWGLPRRWELVENYATEMGAWPDLIATGGDAKALFDGWELVHAIAPDLTLYGVALAYTEHQIRHSD